MNLLRFGAEDLSSIRFAFGPAQETVISLRALTTGSPNGLHGPWLREVRPRLGDLDLELLTAVVRPTGYIPDFLRRRPGRLALRRAWPRSRPPTRISWPLNCPTLPVIGSPSAGQTGHVASP